ncbi:hypothetical protein [Pseudoduganella danionis]|jgi:hypothetical protein|uniref:hypothetical protein n=1 Tax=Pseudoduganella danionis TaxID=1890295 RepID=UPI0035B11813
MWRCVVLLGVMCVTAVPQACPLAEDLVHRYGISAIGFEHELPAAEVDFGRNDERVLRLPLNGRGALLDGFIHRAYVDTLSKQAWIQRSGGYAGVYEWYGPVSVDLGLLAGCADAKAPAQGAMLAGEPNTRHAGSYVRE